MHHRQALFHALVLAGLVLDVAIPSTPLLARRAPASAPYLAHLAKVDEMAAPPFGTETGHAVDSQRWLASAVLVIAFGGAFAFFAPLAYGAPLTSAEFEARMWLSTWK